MVQYQVLDFPFKGGQNDKIAEQVMPTGLLENAVNLRQRKTGQFVKRDGYTELSGQTIGDGTDLTPITKFGNLNVRNRCELLGMLRGDYTDAQYDEKHDWGVYNYTEEVEDSTQSGWRRKGRAHPSEVTIKRRTSAVEDTGSPTGKKITGTTSGFDDCYVYAYISDDSGTDTLYVKFYDTAEASVPTYAYTATDVLSSDARCRIVNFQTGASQRVGVLYINSSFGLQLVEFQPDGTASSSQLVSPLTINNTYIWTAIQDPNDDTYFLLAYEDTSNEIVVTRRNASGS